MTSILIGNYLWELRDKRLDGWPFMDNPWPTIALTALYLLIVKILGPSFMRDREAFELKRPIQLYNIVQVVLGGYIFYEGLAGGWATYYNWVCQPVDTSPRGMIMAKVCYLYYMGKFLDFFGTFFYVARKKFRQVSTLQVIHHSIMPLYGWILTRWLPGGHESFGGIFNSLIRVFTYSYYFLASLGPQFQKYLGWKKYLTTIQIIQFLLIFIHSAGIVFYFECEYPWKFSLISLGVMGIFFGMFLNFYAQEYSSRQSKVNKDE